MRTAGCRRQRPFKTFGFFICVRRTVALFAFVFPWVSLFFVNEPVFFFASNSTAHSSLSSTRTRHAPRAILSFLFCPVSFYGIFLLCLKSTEPLFCFIIGACLSCVVVEALESQGHREKKTTATTTTTAAATTAAATTATSFTSNTIGPPRCNGPADPPTIFDRLPRSFFDNRPGFIQFHSPSLPSFTLS